MNQLKGGAHVDTTNQGAAPGRKDEFGRLIEFTGTGFLTAGDRITMTKGPKFSGAYNQGGMLISYGTSSNHQRRPLEDGSDVKARLLGMSEETLPGDLLIRKSGLPIKSRMAAIIRQRSLDIATVVMDFLERPGFSRLPRRGHGLVDIPTFRRCLCYAFGEQWSSLGMTSPEFMETYSPYIAREQSDDGDALILWKHFAADIMKTAGVDKGDLGYLKEEVDLEQRVSVTNQEQDDLTEEQKAELQRVIDSEFSHDIETEEEKQIRVLKDVERVTGARSVAVTRYGSYEAKMYGRNSMGVIKQGEFDAIGQSEEEAEAIRKAQGINADGTRVKTVNAQISGQTHEFAADGTIEIGNVTEYNAAKAANATSYSAEAQQSLAGQGPTAAQIADREARMKEAARQGAIRMKATQQVIPNSNDRLGQGTNEVQNQIYTDAAKARRTAGTQGKAKS